MTNTITNKDLTVITPPFRVWFANLFEPKIFTDSQGNSSGKPKYSVGMIFPESTNIDNLKRAVNYAMVKKWPDKKIETLKANIYIPFKSGDTVEWDDIDNNSTLVVAKSTKIVKIKNEYREDIDNPDEIYSGCWMRAIITAFAYDTLGKGVTFILKAVQKLKDDMRFDGSMSAEEGFDDELSKNRNESTTDFDPFGIPF